MIIREMGPKDIAACYHIRRSSRDNPLLEEDILNPDGWINAYRMCLERETERGWMAEWGGDGVGFVLGENEYGEIRELAVLPDFERRGIGQALLVTMQQWLLQNHYSLHGIIRPDPSLSAYGFLLRRGWTLSEYVDEDGDEMFFLDFPEKANQ